MNKCQVSSANHYSCAIVSFLVYLSMDAVIRSAPLILLLQTENWESVSGGSWIENRNSHRAWHTQNNNKYRKSNQMIISIVTVTRFPPTIIVLMTVTTEIMMMMMVMMQTMMLAVSTEGNEIATLKASIGHNEPKWLIERDTVCGIPLSLMHS